MPRKEYVLFRDGYRPSKRDLKADSSKTVLLEGLDCLKALWKKGLKPKDLNKHYFLTWFCFANGVMVRQSQILRMRRQSLIEVFGRIGLGNGTYKLRRIWLKILWKHPKKPFHDLLFSFYRKAVKKPVFSPAENEKLIRLWKMGFPLKALLPHFVLCAFQEGLSIEGTAERLGVDWRTIYGYISLGSREGSPVWQWLSPLRPKAKDWYPKMTHRGS